jgi:hypothetical protein
MVSKRYGSHQRLAAEIGLTVSGFCRAAKSGTLSIESVLRLAFTTGENPSVLLRLAGKGDVADLIEALYGAGRATSPHARAVAELVEGLPPTLAEMTRQWFAAWVVEHSDLGDRKTDLTQSAPHVG